MATRTVAAGGGNWDAVGTWEEGAVPIAGDDVVLDAGSGNLTINIATAPASGNLLSLDCTGFSGTLAGGTNQINVGGNVTLSADMTITGTGTLNIAATGTVTPNGKAWPGTFKTNGTAPTVTVSGAWTVAACNPSQNGGYVTLNGLLTVSTMTLPNASFTFNGTNGWICTTLNNTTPTGGRTITLLYGNSYECTTNLNLAGVSGSVYIRLQSSHATEHVVFNFTGAASPNLTYVNATRINSNGGLLIYTSGTIVTSENWSNGEPPSRSTMRNVYSQAAHRSSNL